MRQVLFKAVPFRKDEATLALESGADGLIVPPEDLAMASSLARCAVLSEADLEAVALRSREDEALAASMLERGVTVMLRRGWEVIPVEHLLARGQAESRARRGSLALEAANAGEAALAAGILEQGADILVVGREDLAALPDILAAAKRATGVLSLTEAEITDIVPSGMGHRVCVDTLSLFRSGQGMLVGNSAAFTFLVNAETGHNAYVASRPFRVNAGAVHAYALMPDDRTVYLEELRAGASVLIADQDGGTSLAVVGRVKVERRPMLLVRARAEGREGTVFLQNAETVGLVRPGGETAGVVSLCPGDRILCRLDGAGRHFGMRIQEMITEG